MLGESACYSSAQPMWWRTVVTAVNGITEQLDVRALEETRFFITLCTVLCTISERRQALPAEKKKERSLLTIMETPHFCRDDSEALNPLCFILTLSFL